MTPLRTTLLASLGLFALAGEAAAHAHLTAATPAVNGSVAASPTVLRLTFSEALELKFTGITITGPDKVAIPTGTAALAAGDGTVLVVPISARFAPGTYTVDWHALAKDGHKTTGRYMFTVQP